MAAAQIAGMDIGQAPRRGELQVIYRDFIALPGVSRQA